MKTPLILLAAGLGVLLLSAGCSSLIYYATSRTGSETPPQPRLALTRDDVEAKLGKPVAVTPLPDGGQVATYEYRLRDWAAGDAAKATAAIHAFLWIEVPYLGPVISVLAEPVFTGMAIYNAANPSRGQVTFTYGPDGRLLDYGLPPSYGPPEDAVEPPSVGAFRQSCWLRDRAGPASVGTGGGEAATEERASRV